MKRGLFIKLGEEQQKVMLSKAILKRCGKIPMEYVLEIIDSLDVNNQYNITVLDDYKTFINFTNKEPIKFVYYHIINWGYMVIYDTDKPYNRRFNLVIYCK